jgi:hypothetical protein
MSTKSSQKSKKKETPKRKQAQEKNFRPLIPKDRKLAKKLSREKAKQNKIQEQEALRRGDESSLPPKDKGPIKRFIRLCVDARFSIAEYFMPAALVLIVLTFVSSMLPPTFAFIMVIAAWIALTVFVIDCIVSVVQIRKRVMKKFGEYRVKEERGINSYIFMRTSQMRFFRLPKPINKKGEWPS